MADIGQLKSIVFVPLLDYAADGQMLAEALAFNTFLFTLHEKYDNLGRNQGYALSNEVTQITGTMQSFDQYGRLNQVAVDGISGAFTYGYLEGTHLQKSLAMPNGVTRTFGYEPNRDLLTMIVHSNATERLVQRDFGFDGHARLQDRTLFRANETPVQPDDFGYNIRSELTNALIGANAFAYNFDPIGNRLAATEFGTNTAYTANALNQYTQLDLLPPTSSFFPQHDADGNQTLLKTTTGIWHVTYNAENRPILFSNETTVVSMSYDYMGRRFEYKETVSGTLTRHERFLYRGYLQIVALDMLNSASIKHAIVWDPKEAVATRPLAMQTGTNTYFYSYDQVKNVTELFDVSGSIAATYDYAPFGSVAFFQITQSGNNALTQFSNPLTFSSEVHDSTLGLQYYNYRHLNTLEGRWISRDPIEDVSFFKRKNLQFQHYLALSLAHTHSELIYCGNQAIFDFDLLGLYCDSCQKRDITTSFAYNIEIPMTDFKVNLNFSYRLQESECPIVCSSLPCVCGSKTSKMETYSGGMAGSFTIKVYGGIRIGEVAFKIGATGYKEENYNSCTGVRTGYDELGFFANISGGPCIYISKVAKWCVKVNVTCKWQANGASGRSSSGCTGSWMFETCVMGVCSSIPLGKNDRR